MRFYVASRFDGSNENIQEINNLCSAIADAGIECFHATRDMVGPFAGQKELWLAARKNIQECDAILVDISDVPTGGRLVEVGIAYALNMPVYIIVKNDIQYKSFYDGIATAIYKYDEINDITVELKYLNI